MNGSTVRAFGIEKAIVEPSRVRRLGYQLVGEIHIPGRIRIYHVLRTISSLNLPERGVSMLDAGTGRGDLALHFARMHPQWNVRGFDTEDDRVEHCADAARRLGLANVRFDRGDALALGYNSEFDLITCTDVLEHIQDDQLAVNNLARAVKPGGYLVMTFPSVPQRPHLWTVAWREKRTGFKPEDIGHVRQGYSPGQITLILERAGLDVRRVRWTYGPFGNLAHDIFFTLGDSKPNPVVFAAALPFLLMLSFIEGRTEPRHGSGLLVIARKP